MIKIHNLIFHTNVETILQLIRTETNGEYLKKQNRSAGNIMVTCPFHSDHNENHPSCGVISDSTSSMNGVYNCFTCGAKGSIIDLTSACLGIDYSSAIVWMKNHFTYSKEVKEDLLPEITLEKEKENKIILDESVLDDYSYFHPYMFERGLTEEIIRKFRIGCTPEGDYITFPCWDEDNNLIGICKRSVKGKEFILPKNMPKSIYLLNFILKDNISTVYVCEGQFDALKMWVYGYPAIALFGAGTSKYQMQILNSTGIRNYILMYDNDSAGRKGASRFKNLIRKDVFVTDILMPQGKDCGDCTKQEIDNLLNNI